jgi:hypothetical protein
VPLEAGPRKEIYRALDVVLRRVNKADFRVTRVECDQEFKSIMDDVADDMEITMNYTTTEWTPAWSRAEQPHTIGERIRAGYLYAQRFAEVDASEISRDEYHWLNVFPAKVVSQIIIIATWLWAAVTWF